VYKELSQVVDEPQGRLMTRILNGYVEYISESERVKELQSKKIKELEQ
jgi:hypothetical protein